jgi:hypothetical protein
VLVSKIRLRRRVPPIGTLRGWAIALLQEAGAIRECEDHGWTQDRAYPDARRCRWSPAGIAALFFDSTSPLMVTTVAIASVAALVLSLVMLRKKELQPVAADSGAG